MGGLTPGVTFKIEGDPLTKYSELIAEACTTDPVKTASVNVTIDVLNGPGKDALISTIASLVPSP